MMKTIHKPTLLIDKNICLSNIEQMMNKCRKSKVRFRPHFKTHHSIEIGNWFKPYGVNAITVSSLEMAIYFSKDWNNITLAIPVNLREIDQINELAEKIELNVLLEDMEVAKLLNQQLTYSVGVYVKIDTGYGRTGIHSDNISEIEDLLKLTDESMFLDLKGLLAHAGHTYNSQSKHEILTKGQECIDQLNDLKLKFTARFPRLELSVGDTPFCSVAEAFNDVDEIRPGNFVFYDVMQEQIGSNYV